MNDRILVFTFKIRIIKNIDGKSLNIFSWKQYGVAGKQRLAPKTDAVFSLTDKYFDEKSDG